MSSRVDLHLRIRVKPENRDALIAFLCEAIPFYEAPGGIKVRLMQCEDDPTQFIEIIEYADENTYQIDRNRAKYDRQMHEYLVRWRTLLNGPPEVVAYREIETRE